MGIQLDRVVPWGRCLAEYERMFNLNAADKAGSILDCGAGPASFTAEMTRLGHRVLACDPIYQFNAAEIQHQIHATRTEILEKVRQQRDSYVWRDIASPEQLEAVRMAAMEAFLADFPDGLAAGRYIAAGLPTLPFADGQFELALSSHFLLMYAAQLGEPFHLQAVDELCRVAREVRIFPVVTVSGEPSPYLATVRNHLAAVGYRTTLETVSYEFQKGGNQMLRIQPGRGTRGGGRGETKWGSVGR
jgi:SAM-dependent methyltransferase